MGKQLFSLKGMIRDFDVSKGSNQYAYEIRNLRLTAQENSTLLAYETEKGNKQYTVTGKTVIDSSDRIVGYGTVNNYLVLFTHSSTQGDKIYRLNESTNDSMECVCLYGYDTTNHKDLGFTNSTELETLGVYENEDIQKMYWIDGIHQPRVINIMDITSTPKWQLATICPFDFVPEMQFGETVTIQKLTNVYGIFAPGTIQYLLCYHMANGQQTNAFYMSPIYYISYADRGGSPEDSINNAFEIKIENPDTNFDYVTIYSVQRTSEDSTPMCRKVVDIKISSSDDIFHIDNGINTEVVDYSEIMYLGGANIIPYTMAQKNNTLFFGGIKDDAFFIDEEDMSNITSDISITFEPSSAIEFSTGDTYYNYVNQLDHNAAEITTFMSGESYYFGVILQNKYGQWSNVIPLNTSRVQNTQKITYNNGHTQFYPVRVKVTFPTANIEYMQSIGAKKIKLVRLKEAPSVVCQGIIAPTVFNKNRIDGIYGQASWYFRAKYSESALNFVHNYNIKTGFISTNSKLLVGEIEGAEAIDNNSCPIAIADVGLNDTDFFVDWNLLTVNSPEILYDRESISNCDVNVIGSMPVSSGSSSIFVTLAQPPAYSGGSIDTIPTSNTGDYIETCKARYTDYRYSANENLEISTFPVFSWHRDGSLRDQPEKIDNLWYGELGTKCMASLRTSGYTIYYNNSISLPTSEIKTYGDDNSIITISKDDNNLDYTKNITYRGQVDQILTSRGYNMYQNNTTSNYKANTPVVMRYKSTKHGVFQLKYTNDNLQKIFGITGTGAHSYEYPFWSNRRTTIDSTGYDGVVKVMLHLTSSDEYINYHLYDNENYIYIRKGLIDSYAKVEEGDLILVDSTFTIGGHKPRVMIRVPQPVLGTTIPTDDYTNTCYCFFEGDSSLYNVVGTFLGVDTDGKKYDIVSTWSGGYNCTVTQSGQITAKTLYDEILIPIEAQPAMYLVNMTRTLQPIQSFYNTSWIVAGMAEDISAVDTEFDLLGTIGDAYFQRFDCLKTYPYSTEDQNQIVEIFSFMLETRVNLDGRYDNNRGLVDNTGISNTNFNLLNIGYTQEDNFMSSSYLEPEDFLSNVYPNQIMWTDTKVYGSKIDQWTHVIPTSTLDMDGNLGKVSALKLWNDKLICFQDKGIALISYNERTALAATTGVPIELANSGKVDGKTYISTTIGCSNKNTIQVTQKGLYFADSNTREVYRYGEGLTSLSKEKGFNTYFYDKTVRFGNMKTFYDPKLKDVYFRIYRNSDMSIIQPSEVEEESQVVNRGVGTTDVTVETLVFNEQFEEFTSILDYDMKYLFPLGDSLVSIQNNSGDLWKQFAGDYLKFYGASKGYNVEVLCSENPTVDKTFVNVEFRADVWGTNNSLASDSNTVNPNVLPFDRIKAWNEYQNTGDVTLVKGNNLQQKFRIWRVDMPRDNTSFVDRIRNPWLRLRLSKTSDTTPLRAVVHDVGISYL